MSWRLVSQSSHSFILSLNDCSGLGEKAAEGFEGGGTYFHDLHRVVSPGEQWWIRGKSSTAVFIVVIV